MRKLYWMPGTCALAVHVALEQIAKPYSNEKVDRNDLRSPAYLAINPMGVVPTLLENNTPLVEVAAILLHLTDAEPDSDLGPAVGHADRFELYRWLSFLSGTVHPHFWPFFAPARYIASEQHFDAVKQAAAQRVYGDWDVIDAHLSRREWLVGQSPTVADALLLPMARWGMLLERPTRNWSNIQSHLARVSEWRPAAAALAAQGLKAPT